jgi:glycosyltransferase involved in cell wall biosynthesis
MKNADALLLFHDTRFERYIPGKLYGYLAAGTPILLFDDTGETRYVLERMKAGWLVGLDNADELQTAIRRLLNGEVARRSPELDEWLLQHTRERTSMKFLSAIERLQPPSAKG